MNKRARRVCIFAAIVVSCLSSAVAQDARQIVEETQTRSRASSQRYEGLLQVIDAKSKVSEKKWTYERIGSYGNSKSIIKFTAPAEVKGVALLVVNHTDRASDQWMWTPSINRDRRIALQDRSTRFFGTDFSFEDLEERDVDQYQYSMKGEDAINGEACWKIEEKPTAGKNSQYTSTTVWIRKANYTYAQLENFSNSKLVRRLKYLDLANVQGIWTAKTLDMQDFTRNSRTVLRLEALEYNVPVKDEQFTLQALRRL
jgi:hypothetical protein